MKRINNIIVLICTALYVTACVQPLDSVLQEKSGKYNLELSVRCLDPTTKATIPGEEIRNENTITTLDWFVFSSIEDDAVAIEHGRAQYTDKTNVTAPFTVTSLDMERYVNTTTKTFSGYVYVIANLPATYTHSTLAALTLDELKKLEVITTLDVLDAQGKFKAQDNFVMASSLKEFTLTESATQASVLAPLSRVASKITLDISVVSAIDEIVAQMSGRDTLAEQYLQTWYPDVENIQIYLSYANSRTSLNRTLFDETPYTYDNTNFFTYNRYGFTPSITRKSDMSWEVEGTPFYSYPMRWNNNDEHAPFIKIILPWRPYSEEPTYEQYPYIVHDKDGVTHMGNKLVSASRENINNKTAAAQEFYYKINLPLDDNSLSSNTWYKLALDVAILGGRTDDVSMELAGKYYVVDWNNPDFTAGGELTQGSYLSLATPRDTFFIYGGNYVEIPVISSHNLVTGNNKTSITGAKRWNAKTKQWENNISRGSISTNGRSSVQFTNTLNTDIDEQLDCYYMVFDVKIVNEVGLEEEITIVQYPSIYIDCWTGGNVMVDGYYGRNANNRFASYRANNTPTFGNSSNNSETTSADTPYAPITQYVSNDADKNMIVLTISAFGENSKKYTIPAPSGGGSSRTEEYLITDPRVNANYTSSDLIPYFNGSETNPSYINWGNKAAGVFITDRVTTNFIAPKFLIASRWGRTGSWGNGAGRYETAIKRCATYQEAGYPAGRWRLPTEAEIMFMADLQSLGFINKVFSNDGQNISASGSVIRVRDNGEITYWTQTSNTVGSSCRCVYDLWYWGDDPVSGAETSYTIGVE